jgi:hypothetical protein
MTTGMAEGPGLVTPETAPAAIRRDIRSRPPRDAGPVTPQLNTQFRACS